MKNRLGYLSAAPRVSTRPEAEASGPRVHVLGVMKAFEAIDWQVKPFIVGDRVPRQWVSKGSEQMLRSGLCTLAADLVRLCMGVVNAHRAWQELGGQVDWVYERLATLQSLGWIFKLHSVPWILETNAPLFYEAEAERKSLVLTKLARWIEVQAYRKSDVLVCTSEALREIVVEELGIQPQKVMVVPNGVDTEYIAPERYETKRLFTSFTVGFVGNLSAWQGLDLLLKSLHALRAEGLDICLVVVGDGPMRQEWESLTHNLGLTDSVRFLGRLVQDELLPLIAGFDVGYSGHLDLDGKKIYRSPLKLYEYMAMAKPVVSSVVEDVRSLVREGETGFLFSPGDLEGIKQALRKAYNAQEQLLEMGCKARAEVVANHSWIARMQTLIEGVNQILKVEQTVMEQLYTLSL